MLMRTCRFLLRRTAVRAISSTPSSAIFVKPRSISSITPTAFRSRNQQWAAPAFQKRFLSGEPTKVETTEAEAKEVEAKEGFAQTAAEAPIEENLTPAQEQAQAEPTDAKNTVGIDALEKAAAPAPRHRKFNLDKPAPEPNNSIYVGNLYYEVTADQLKRIMTRFGEVESVRIIYDNRGISRG